MFTSMSLFIRPFAYVPSSGHWQPCEEGGDWLTAEETQVPRTVWDCSGPRNWSPCHVRGREQPWEEGGDRCGRGGPGESAPGFQGTTSISNDPVTWGAFMVCRPTNGCEADTKQGPFRSKTD